MSNFEYVLSFGSIIFVIIVPHPHHAGHRRGTPPKTDQLLYSLPVTTTQVVLGKYLALLAVYLVPLAIISTYPLIFARYGDVYLPTSYGSLCHLHHGRRPHGPGGVHLLPDRKSGHGGRYRGGGHPLQLLQRQPLGVCIHHRRRHLAPWWCWR
ncbi:MAG: hypothetical protein V8Q30_14085 [Acutalibacteraceae bacterium]